VAPTRAAASVPVVASAIRQWSHRSLARLGGGVHSGHARVDLGGLLGAEPGGLAVEDDLAGAQTDDPVGEIDGQLHLVQGGDDGEVILGGDLPQQVDDVAGRYRVEGGDRLIGEQHLRVLHECAGDRDPLLLTAGERVGALVGAVGQTDPVEFLEGFAADGLRVHHQGDARSAQRSERPGADVLEHGHRADEVEGLEDDADVAAHGLQLRSAQPVHVLTEDAHPPRGGAVQSVDMAQEGGFAGAGEAEEDADSAGAKPEVDVVEAEDSAAEVLRHMVELDGIDGVDLLLQFRCGRGGV
jgi:hypothetical protein